MSSQGDSSPAAPISGGGFVPPSPEVLQACLQQYEVHSLIAVGGMGAVYAGVQKDLDRPVAIKILPPDAARDGESIERFRTEAKAMARLTHPHIPAVFDFGVIDEYCLLIMELIEGENVFTLLQRKELTPSRALRIFSEVCDAIHFAHSRGIVHGDLKPGNILLNAEGHAKLADFGLARLMVHEGKDAQNWVPMGTPEYAAPELYDRHATADHRADIYSLGVVLHEMLTGAPPSGEFELPATGLKLDPRIDTIIAKCMESDPARRYQSAAEIKALARDILEARNVPARTRSNVAPTRHIARHQGVLRPVAPPRAPTPPAPKRSALGPMLSLAALAVIVIGAIAMFFKKPNRVANEAANSPPTAPTVAPVPSPSTVVPSPDPPAPESSAPELIPVAPEADPEMAAVPTPKPSEPTGAPTSTLAPIESEITTIRDSFRDRWRETVGKKQGAEYTRITELYAKALGKLEADYMARGDAASTLEIRNELARFKSTRAGVAPGAISKIERLAGLQAVLNDQVQKLSAQLKPEIDAFRKAFIEALTGLATARRQGLDEVGADAAAAAATKVAAASVADFEAMYR
jgi:serine/threonine protein kinase